MWLQVEDDGMLAGTKFATTPFADDIYQLNVEKVLNAWSIGFIPKKWEYDEKSEITTYTDLELLEYSSVSLPMNQDAVTEGLKMVKSDFVKNILIDQKQTIENQKILTELKDEIAQLKVLYDKLQEHLDRDDIGDLEKAEKDILELKKQVNNLLVGTSGNKKVLDEVLHEITGDVSHY